MHASACCTVVAGTDGQAARRMLRGFRAQGAWARPAASMRNAGGRGTRGATRNMTALALVTPFRPVCNAHQRQRTHRQSSPCRNVRSPDRRTAHGLACRRWWQPSFRQITIAPLSALASQDAEWHTLSTKNVRASSCILPIDASCDPRRYRSLVCVQRVTDLLSERAERSGDETQGRRLGR